MSSRGKLMVLKALEGISLGNLPGNKSKNDKDSETGSVEVTDLCKASGLPDADTDVEKEYTELIVVNEPELYEQENENSVLDQEIDYESTGSEYIPSSEDNESDGDEVNGQYQVSAEVEANPEVSVNEQVTNNIASAILSTGVTTKRKHFPLKEKNSKVRLRNPQQWKKNSAAIARQKGKSYKSQNGKVVPAKTVNLGELCTNKCRLNCSSKFSVEHRNRILHEFYDLDVNAKNALLFKSILPRTVARQKKNARKHKSCSYIYSIVLDNKEIIVCKLALCSLYQIGRKKLDIIKQKLSAGQSAPSKDARGKHASRPHKTSLDVEQCIINHIAKFPTEESHYSRNSNPNKRYLSPILNISIMHRLYIEECEQNNMPNNFFVKISLYRKLFNTKFNLSFSHPKSDNCSTCDSGAATEEHKQNIHAGYELMKNDRNSALVNDNVCYLTVDMQQTKPLPKLSTSKAFYLRQLWLYNLGIHTITTNGHKPIMQTWTEDIGGKGSCEVISSLWNFIQTSEDVKTKNHLIIWSDSCSGQNKNFNMICFFQFLILKGIFETIDHKFPEVGHTYLDSDRDFGRIEKVLRKHQIISTPQQYRDIIKTASTKTCIVHDMEHYFKDTETLACKLGLVQKKKNVLNEKIRFRDGIKWIRVIEFGSYLYKDCYDEYTPFKKVSLFKNSVGTVPLNDVKLDRLKTKTGRLSVEKLDNIRTQLPFIPEEHHWFYEQFLEMPPAEKKRRTL